MMDKLHYIVTYTLPEFVRTASEYGPRLERMKDESKSEFEALKGLDNVRAIKALAENVSKL